MDSLLSFFGRHGYLPHGYCFTWSPGVLWTMVGSDLLVAASYFSIPLALVSFVRKRGEVSNRSILWLFSAFIFACGTTHLMDVWTIWRPDYGLQAMTKLMTAGVSVVTAFALWPLIPKALKIPSVAGLQSVIASLEAEIARRRSAEDNLADTQESLAITLDSIGAGFVTIDRDGRINRMNPVAERITGWPLDDARGRSLWDVWKRDDLPPAYLAQNPIDVLLEHRYTLADTHRFIAISRSGVRTPVQIQAALIRNADDSVRGAAFVLRDLSEAHRLEEMQRETQRLESENREIQEANRIKSEFLANMSHELRTPLNAIIGFADVLHSGMVPLGSDRGTEFLGHIGTSGRHLLQLINDVLDLSKVESGTFDFYPEALDLPRLVHEVTDILHADAARKGVQIEVELDTGLAGLAGLVLDPSRLKQVLYNFMSNAIKFTPDGGRMTVRAMASGETDFRIEVEDTGIGIAEADLGKLFQQFSQVHGGSAKMHQGTGLGLALTRRLAELQGGTVGVRSELGVGSVFHALLPRVVRRGQDAERSAMARAANSDAATILVIEDDLDDQARISKELTDAGFQVQLAATADQAIRRAEAQPFAAITLDLVLPDRSGLEVLAAIRRSGVNQHTPVVVVTMMAEHSALAGFQVADVLAKPLQQAQLVDALRRAGVPHAPGAQVLVIDDDPAALALMRTSLASIGIEATCRADGARALQEIDDIRPDAIILDLSMPGFDGFQVLQGLRDRPAWRNTPVFIWTAMTLSDAELATLSRSAGAILAKGDSGLEALLTELRRRPPTASPAEASP